MENIIDHNDITNMLSQVGEHECTTPLIESKDFQGNSINNTYMGFTCTTCDKWFRVPLSVAKAMPIPLRKYLQKIEDRRVLAKRFTKDSKQLLLELRSSGGWFQPDPGVAFMTMMSAALGPPNNLMEQKLKAMFEPQSQITA